MEMFITPAYSLRYIGLKSPCFQQKILDYMRRMIMEFKFDNSEKLLFEYFDELFDQYLHRKQRDGIYANPDG